MRAHAALRSWAALLAATGFLAGSMGAGRAQSDSAQSPDRSTDAAGPKSPISSFLPSTNAVSSSFLDSHPELEQSVPAVPSNDNTLTLHSGEALPPPDNPTPAAEAEAPPDLAPSAGNPNQLAAHLLVVYNTSDSSSKSLAEYYASRRHIPNERVLGISCSTEEQITRTQYEATIRDPIVSYIFDQHWMTRRSVFVRVGDQNLNLLVATHNDVWAIVLMRGIPLRVAEDPTREGQMQRLPALSTNAAAVDSELALLPVFGLPPGGFVPNIFFDRTGSSPVRAGPDLATKIILVTRLDGPRPSDVRRMIDDSLYAEHNRLAGMAVIDSRGLTGASNYAIGDNWLRDSRDMLAHDGWPVRFDDMAAVLPPTDPLNHVAIYLGWYHEGAYGPWITPPNRFVRGAIAYHLHSFSATTVRSDTAAWVGPLIAHGAAATMGCVYEPYLDLTPHLDIFVHHLLQGNTFAEAAYASERGLSWMVTVVGDPLYRPFGRSIDSVLADSNETTSDHNGWLLLQQVKRGLAHGDIPNDETSLEHYLDVHGAVVQEGLGDLLERIGDPAADEAALRAYQEAATLDIQPVDRIRVGLKLARQHGRSGDDSDETADLRALWDLYPTEAVTFAVPPLTTSGQVATATNPAPIDSPLAATTVPASTYPGTLPRPPKPPQPPKPTSPISDNP